MKRFTTPTLKLGVPLDITGSDIYVSIRQGANKLQKSGTAIVAVYDSADDVTELSVTLAQDETAIFSVGSRVRLQVNWITPDGTRDATDIWSFEVTENLLNEVIEYGN